MNTVFDLYSNETLIHLRHNFNNGFQKALFIKLLCVIAKIRHEKQETSPSVTVVSV